MKKTYKEKRRGHPLSTTTACRTQLLLSIYIDTHTHWIFSNDPPNTFRMSRPIYCTKNKIVDQFRSPKTVSQRYD